MIEGLRHIPLSLLASLTDRPIEFVERRLADYANRGAGIVPITSAIGFVYSLRPKVGKPGRRVKMRLPLLLVLTLRDKTPKFEEDMYRAIAEFGVAQARGTDLLQRCQPIRVGGRVQKKLNRACPFDWIAMRLIAYSARCSASDVFVWFAGLYLANTERLQRHKKIL